MDPSRGTLRDADFAEPSLAQPDKDSESLVQPGRKLADLDAVQELPGTLDVHKEPEVTSGFSNVFRGIWINLQGAPTEVAVKEFKKLAARSRQDDRSALDAKATLRIKREVFVWSQTHHPNLHPFLGYRSQPQPRLISPWCRHGNLADFIQRTPNLSRLDKLNLLRQVASAISYLHSLNPPICHGDIKPENVLINDDLDATLSDFGLSRVLMGLGVSTGFTTSDTADGTISYMAGELLVDEYSRSNCETDVYAFGGLILAVMSEKPPFFGLTKTNILLRMVLHKEPPRVEDHPLLLPSDSLWNLIHRCWHEVPQHRPSMSQILDELNLNISLEETALPYKVTETVDELEGRLDLPDNPEMSSGATYMYHGYLFGPSQQRVEVAVKEIELSWSVRSNVTGDLEALKKRTDIRLKREIATWIRTKHPNIYPLLGYSSSPQPRIISPWCLHGNISDYLEQRPDLPRQEKLKLVYQVASGLGYLHSLNPPVSHGAIKPENVLINDHLQATITDYALGEVIRDLGISSGLTSRNARPTSAAVRYKALELLEGELPDSSTDVYAFGGLTLKVMSRLPPFPYSSGPVIIRRVFQGRPPESREHPGLEPSDPLWSLMRRCWGSDRHSRPKISELVLELRTLTFYDQDTLPKFAASKPTAKHYTSSITVSDVLASGLLAFFPEQTPRQATLTNPRKETAQVTPTQPENSLNKTTQSTYPLVSMTLSNLECNSSSVPIVGNYIRDVARLVISLLAAAEVLDRDDNVCLGLRSHASKLATILSDLKNLAELQQGETASLRVTDIQKELQCLRQLLKKSPSLKSLNELLASHGGPGEQKKRNHGALEQIRTLLTLCPDLAVELEDRA
ncbi:hypothetical protein FRB90_000390 [Tulasnella sp. 427]|nr:hypothetical protein FRB90_000390 [Tulasnella sp. 427]